MADLRDKVAIVTGGASGIGEALSKELGKRGAIVYVTDIDEGRAKDVASSIVASGGTAESFALDVSSEEQVAGLIGDIASKHGRLDYMFNNAGMAVGGELRDLDMSQFRRVLDVNLWGVINGTYAAYKIMERQGHGHIVNVASMVGLVPVPMETAYVTSKHAVVGLSNSLRVEGAALGVRVSVVCPDFIKTRFYTSSRHVNVDEDKLIAQIPSFFFTSPERCARVILRGVNRNRGIITIGIYVRLLWRLYRTSPRMVMRGQLLYARKLRKLRLEDA
ncbi:MAG: SDR family oxidoreductase [Actinomycetota bacterium]